MELETLRVHNERMLTETTDRQELVRQVASPAHLLALHLTYSLPAPSTCLRVEGAGSVLTVA